ncbi:cell wall mannoprotein 1 family protein [Aspergillus foveolatus]|uniref:cell wall mannoprotein 1 family protein n=1 Tax=Aspergillus foveolatus TaxID=210207 RepID=UPI003CCE10A5
MKFTTVFTLPTLYFLTTLSAPILAARVADNPTSSLLTLLTTRLTTLDTVISSYTGDADIIPIQSASNALIITIDRGLRDISTGPDLTAAETKALSPQFQALTTSVKTTISRLVEKRPLLDGTTTTCTGDISSIQKSLHNQYAIWDKLFSLISSKAPEEKSAFVTSFAEGILSTIQEGLGKFVDIADSTSSCLPDTTSVVRLELRSYGNGNSSVPGNETSTQVPTISQQSTVPEPPAFTGAAVAATANGWNIRMVKIAIINMAMPAEICL